MGDWMVRLTARLGRGGTILFLALASTLPANVVAQGAPHRAGLVVRFGDGSVITRCVTFSEPSITGIELLTRAGLSIRVDTGSSIGAGVCKIERQGCDQGASCFCQCEGSTCAYWQYFHLQNGAWKYSNLGAAVYQAGDGAVDGWAWGNNVAPPTMSLDQICVANEAKVTTASASASVSPSTTRTPENAQTATPKLVTVTSRAAESTFTASPTGSLVTAVPSATVPPPVVPTLPLTSPTAAPTAAAAPQNVGTSSPVTSYVIFGIIVLGLGTWLAAQARRRAH
jgi:hypothetical protein